MSKLVAVASLLGACVPVAAQLPSASAELQPAASLAAPGGPAAALPAAPPAAPPMMSVATVAPPADRPVTAAPLVDQRRLPLQTKGRYIVDRLHYRVKWSCINWAGAYFISHVVGGLDKQPISGIARSIAEMGFNCVRLPYSTQGWVQNPVVNDSHLLANPQLQGGKRFRELFKATVDALTDEGLMVIINNHLSKSGWCCNVKQDEGFWNVPDYTEQQWIGSLTGLAAMFKDNPLVVAFDIRNEPHDIKGRYMTWGDGNPDTDWAAAATRAGNAVLDVNPDVLIVVSALCFCMDLGPIKEHPIKLKLDNRVVYEVHNYIEFQLATLVTNNFMSWNNIQRLCWLVIALLTVVVLGSINAWVKLGKPLPPKGVRTLTFFGWFTVVTILVLCLLTAMYMFYKLYCNYYARTFLTWLMAITSGFLLVGILGILMGVFRHRQARALIEVSEESQDSEDREEESDLLKSKSSGRFAGYGNLGLKTYESVSLAKQLLLTKGSKALTEPVPWDRGLCWGLQACTASTLFGIAACIFCFYASIADSFTYLQIQFDHKWAFALDGGHPYTAPVWLGEFGQDRRGQYWQNLLAYMAVRDVDFAYWALNGDKLSYGYFDSGGNYVEYPEPKWESESFGMFERDYKTLRHTWKLLDLQAIMKSPAGWVPDSYPCDRKVLGNACGG